jgi:hypothetical protein
LKASGADTYLVLLSEEELVEIALLRYAQQKATSLGAARFAAEFRRRDLEERWLEAARSRTTPHSPERDASEVPLLDSLTGPVDAATREKAAVPERHELRLMRPKYERHSSVPRPPIPEPEPDRRRLRRRKRALSSGDHGWRISPAEAARMSAAGRRLYGLDEPHRDR